MIRHLQHGLNISADILQAMTVYQAADQFITYGTGQTVVDDTIGLKIPLSEIF